MLKRLFFFPVNCADTRWVAALDWWVIMIVGTVHFLTWLL